MPLVEDFRLFLADFARDVVLAGATVRAIYDEPADVSPLGVPGAATTMPQLTLRTADVPASVYGAAVTVPPVGAFRVTEHRPDGTGLSVLMLERAT